MCLLFAGLSKHYALQLTVKDGIVFGKSREDIDPATPWSEYAQLFPPPLMPEARPHPADTTPGAAPLQEWKAIDQLKRDLTKFYANKLKYKVTHIPEDIQEGELFLLLLL